MVLKNCCCWSAPELLCSQDCGSLGFADLFCLGRPALPAVPASGTRLGGCRDAYTWLAAATGLVLGHGATGFIPCFWGGRRKAFREAVVMGSLSRALRDLGAGRRLGAGGSSVDFHGVNSTCRGFLFGNKRGASYLFLFGALCKRPGR